MDDVRATAIFDPCASTVRVATSGYSTICMNLLEPRFRCLRSAARTNEHVWTRADLDDACCTILQFPHVLQTATCPALSYSSILVENTSVFIVMFFSNPVQSPRAICEGVVSDLIFSAAIGVRTDINTWGQLGGSRTRWRISWRDNVEAKWHTNNSRTTGVIQSLLGSWRWPSAGRCTANVKRLCRGNVRAINLFLPQNGSAPEVPDEKWMRNCQCTMEGAFRADGQVHAGHVH